MKSTTMLATGGAAVLLLAAGQASAQDWRGFYAGGFAGYAMTQGQNDETTRFDTNLDGTFNDTVRTTAGADAFSTGFCDGSPNGNNAGAGCSDDADDNGEIGLRAGYDWQTGSIVFGVVGDISYAGGEDSVTAFSTTPANYSFERDLDSLVAVRGRLGYATGRYLPYVTAGYARGKVNSSFSSSNTANSFTPSNRDEDVDGYQLGGGVETMVTSNIKVGLEYVYTSLDDDEGHVVRIGPGTATPTNPFLLTNAAGTDIRRSNDNVELHAFRVTAALRF